VAEQWLWRRSGTPGIRTFVPAFTVRPRPAIVFFNAVPLAASTASAGFSTFGLLIEIDSTWIGLQLGIRASVTWSQTAVWKTHFPSVLPSWSQPGSPSMHDCVVSGKPLLTFPFGSLIRHSAMHELRARPPGKSRSPPGSGTTLQFASHPLPGCPFCAPASHSSEHSTLPLPQASMWQAALQPSHDALLPSSHCSPGSRWPSPQAAVGPGHGGRVGSSVLIAGGLTDPVIAGGVPGSRYVMVFVDGGVVRRVPLIVALPLALIRFPKSGAGPPIPFTVRIWLGCLTVTLQPASVIWPTEFAAVPAVARSTSFVTTSRPSRSMVPPSPPKSLGPPSAGIDP